MPVPATTGQLRTKVSEMEIGDYIKFGSSSLTKGFLFNDSSMVEELPLTGEKSGTHADKFGYLVKVAKGLLVFDRVQAHSISWDVLNTGKFIQGVPFNNPNIIPTMTSNTSPSGVASASSNQESATYGAWKAFDKNTTTGYPWQTTTGTVEAWLQYEFANPTVITQYSIMPTTNNLTSAPKSWRFEGSNDGVNFDLLHEVWGSTGWLNSTKRIFNFSNSKNYKMYRIYITENNGQTHTGIFELEMFETAGVIRSLTGGVAYADANGNKSTTDLGFGGWPANNEWDKYIVNFPQDKIQEGKTIEDVFHSASAGRRTLTQDTYYSSSSSRVARGYGETNAVNVGSSNLTNVNLGFRPCFSYKE